MQLKAVYKLKITFFRGTQLELVLNYSLKCNFKRFGYKILLRFHHSKKNLNKFSFETITVHNFKTISVNYE